MWLAWIGGIAAVAGLVGWAVWQRRVQRRRVDRAIECEKAKQLFRRRREHLEAHCLARASALGTPRGLIWADCDFGDEVAFARDRQTGHLQAFVAVTIRFEAEPGGGMEEVEAVGRLRAATAVFHFDGHDWHTNGRIVFNLTPHETIRRFRREIEPVDLL